MRQRQRADGSWRIWWEPSAHGRTLGLVAVDLDADRPRWSVDAAKKLNARAQTAILSGKRQPEKRNGRSVESLIRSYMQSVHWTEVLAPKTRDSYHKLLLLIEDKWGLQRVGDFDRGTMTAWYETLYRTKGPRSAQALIAMMSILFERAEIIGWRAERTNPCFRLKIRTPAPRDRKVGWIEFEALIAAADTLGRPAMALACLLGMFQGQRSTDVRGATHGAFTLIRPVLSDGSNLPPTWIWSLTRSKNRTAGVLELHPEVVPALRRAMMQVGADGQPLSADTALIRDEVTGRAYDEHLFAKRWAQLRTEAAKTVPSVAGVQFRDLRRTFSMNADALGAGLINVGDALGNSVATNRQLRQVYMPPSFETARRATQAIKRPERTKG